MPLNKLENFIKNTEGRILYVNPNDLDATDAVENQGNSLTKPFKTIQRALVESARFSYLKGSDNDITEKTTILLFPGEHLVDNRPGYAIKDDSGTAKAVSPAGGETVASTELSLKSDSVFDLTQSNNILYKFNSINGGVIVPRGTSIVGLDLRKTKIRPKYVPNPTDSGVNNSAIFRVTGACYFWQFSIFDGDETGLVYTDDSDFSVNNQSKPTFSHHKLTCFEYADGVNIPSGYALTDLDMYYAKLSNAYNTETGRNIDQKWPTNELGFSKQRAEWEIVGAFAADAIDISSVISGDGATPGAVITVTTSTEHELTAGTPIKIKGVGVSDYNISTKVQSVTNSTTFTYLLPFVRNNLPASPSASGATVTIETDTVSGASPYIFNISMRSVWGMNGMHADGAKSSGFRSMVVAQFTAVSLQKDDRAFVKYNETSRLYEGITVSKVTGSALSGGSSSTSATTVYHLDPRAIYRNGWECSHIKASNDAFIQIVSVFAIGFTRHFDARTGADYSVTNSNSNFGQLSLAASGFKKEAFTKDNRGYITSVITPRAITEVEDNIDWISIDVGLTTSVGISSHLYLFGFNDVNDKPPVIIQGYRVGAKVSDKLFFTDDSTTHSADIFMVNNEISSTGLTTALGTNSSFKEYRVSSVSSSVLTLGTHDLITGEKIVLISDSGDLPENTIEHRVYYAIRHSSTEIKLASSLTNAENATAITIYGGTQLKVQSRVSDKESGDIGSPIQYDADNGNWFIHSSTGNGIYTALETSGVAGIGARTNTSFFKRTEDSRSIDEKLYKFRVVIPKEFENAKDPEEGFVLQESSSTGARETNDFLVSTIDESDYDFNRNNRFISTCSVSSSTVTVISELPHDLNTGDKIIVKNVTSTDNTAGTIDIGYNGTFEVTAVSDDKTFAYSTTDVSGKTHNPGTFTNDTSSRTISLPRFERNDLKSNYYIYRNEIITPHIHNVQDGVYHLYVLNADNAITTEFTASKFSQNVTDLYPQLDRDNPSENPAASKSYAKRAPIGDVVTSDLRKSLTRETADKVLQDFSIGLTVSSATATSGGISTITFSREHNLSGIVTYSALSGGSGYNPASGVSTYHNVKLLNDGTSTWDGATAKVVVTNGAVSDVEITAGGSGYTNGEQLYFDSSVIGGTPQANILINTAGISTATGNYVQVTGIGTTAGGYFRITDTSNKNAISIAKTAGDPVAVANQYVINLGPAVTISQLHFSGSGTTGIGTYQSLNSPHGLLAGNALRILDSNNNNLGDYVVNNVNSPNEFTIKLPTSLPTAAWALKHGMSANSASADNLGENLGVRSLSIFDNETLILGQTITTEEQFIIDLPGAGIGTMSRFPLGSYIQIGNEIMRVKASTLTGAGSNQIQVIRGSMGTIIESHVSGSLIKKIKLTPVEFRRPSIIRASGHTFEYLGYGPGNYSTGLPQVQVKTLSEKEDYLASSQETSCGSVLYTGMNSDGDFYIGNVKYSAQSGEQTTFDVPTPTITGEDPNRLSVVFDEVIVKERILVEGGNSGQILSQFDGPVTFNGDIRMNRALILNNNLRVNGRVDFRNTTQSTSCTTGALVVAGGVGIGGDVNICGQLTVDDDSLFKANVKLNDNGLLKLGTSDDLTIYHDGSNSYIADSGTGSLIVQTNTLSVKNAANTEQLALFQENGSVTLHYDGSEKIKTVTDGVEVTGKMAATGAITGASLAVTGNISGASVSISGQIIAGGDITAFASDIRLKENIKPIENALDKVMSLRGFTYTFNEVGASLGYDTNTSHAGVSAQDVFAVLPEATAPAMLDNTYMAVKYDKLVPLLIEAIKELKQEIEDLKNSK